MEEEFENISKSSNTTCQAMPDPGFTAFFIVVSMVLAAIILFNGLIAIMLLRATAVAVQVRVILLNLLVAILIAAVASLCRVLYSVAIALGYVSEPSLLFCHFAIFVYALTAHVRVLGLTLFSFMVLQPVACGLAESGAKQLICSLAPCWVSAFLLAIRVLVPEIFGVQYVGCIACFPRHLAGINEVIRLTISYLVLIGDVALLLLIICILLGTLCYIKRHTISEGDKYRFYAKFAVFLIPGSFLTVLAQAVPIIIANLSTDVVGVYITYSLTYLSYILTPILIVVFLKPVQKQLLRLFCNKCWKNNEAIPMQQAETPT